MKKLTILCDADDTIINLLPRWLAEINQTYGKAVRLHNLIGGSYRKILFHQPGNAAFLEK